jgi:DNA-directed RNA polymerase specialized sigma24 family protein
MDLLARKKHESMFSLDERDALGRNRHDPDGFNEADALDDLAIVEPQDTFLSNLFREAEEVQATVKGRVAPRTWEAFWLVGVSLWSVEETSEHLQMSHASVYKAKERVLKSLQAEGRKRANGDDKPK